LEDDKYGRTKDNNFLRFGDWRSKEIAEILKKENQ
jgi:hypothetical protein